jgi:hypothetical protein
MADYISLVHLFCQKSSIPAPIFRIQQSNPIAAQAPKKFHSLQYIYRCTMEIESNLFHGSWEKSKAEAKKSVAKEAYNFYHDNGNPFFTEAKKELLVSYPTKLNQLCASKCLVIYNRSSNSTPSLCS